ncbi:Glycosyltransferase Family 2 protein [Gigaspora rosea]|uniref:Chitin synthase n=1 Tax=Gigaspora rosea TaxID=44941 RepID=A0A397W2A4_9GLOM|nr:Glycosyltransferase Family 2 protein [Gigaspora rosea]
MTLKILIEFNLICLNLFKFICRDHDNIDNIDNKTIDTNCDSIDSVSIEIDPKESNTITKRIELINGNLVINCPIPLDLLLNISNKSSKEFTHTRYTACTSKPNNFKNENYILRQTEFDLLRQTEIFIEIAIHDEDQIQLSNTLYGVMENIAYLCSLKDSKIWGKDGWKKVVICIISNGHDDNILTYLTALGVYQDNIAKTRVNNKVIKAHIFEYTTQISIKYSGGFMEKKTVDDGIVPIQILFCLKENNKGKNNSHKWFFNAFCPILNPKICVLIKAGTKPGERSIYNLWKTFLNHQVAGTCGRLISMKDKTINPISCAQMFEHEMSNIFDKPFESIFGYITTLPEEFSAYRYCALEDISKNIQGTFIIPKKYIELNRLLCFELISKHNNKQSKWILHYENSSQAEIQVTKNLTDFISQQKKNLNEYFFVSFYSITHFYKIWISGHSIFRKIWLKIEIIYQAYKFIFTWFAFGDFFTIFFLLGIYYEYFLILALCIYVPLIFFHLIISIDKKLQRANCCNVILLMISIIMMGYLLWNCFWHIFHMKTLLFSINTPIIFKYSIFSLVFTYGLLFVLGSILTNPFNMFICFAYHILMVPFYANGLIIYAFCSIDISKKKYHLPELGDVNTFQDAFKKQVANISLPNETIINHSYNEAWNKMKKIDKDGKIYKSHKKKQVYFSNTLYLWVRIIWFLTNSAFVSLACTFFLIFEESAIYYFVFIFWYVAGLIILKFFGSFVYFISRLF